MNFKKTDINTLLKRALSTNLVPSAALVSIFFFISCSGLLLTRELFPITVLFPVMAVLIFISCLFPVLRALMMVVMGFAWCTFIANNGLDNQLKVQYEKKLARLTIVVADFPRGDQSYRSFTARVIKAQYEGQLILQSNAAIRLSCYHCDEVFELGDQFQLDAVLRRPRGLQSWGAFDFEKQALNQGVSATGYIKKVNKKVTHVDTAYMPISFSKYRRRIQSYLQKNVDKEPSLAILSALSVGDRSAFTPETWRVLRATGLSHIVSISGLHIGLVFLVFRWLMREGLNFFYPVYLIIPAIYLESLLALFCASMYAGLAGFSVPTQRALIMLVIYFFSLFSPRKLNLIEVLCLTIGIIMLIDPLAIMGSSFWLSVCAVGLIGLVQLTRKRSIVYFQWFLSLAMAPLVIGFFGEVSVISPLVNVVVVPLISFIVLPLLLMSLLIIEIVPILGEWMLFFLSKIVDFGWESLIMLESMVSVSSLSVTLGRYGYAISFYIFLMIVFWSVLPSKRFLILVLMALIAGKPNKDTLDNGEFILTVLDVGQGLAVTIETSKGVTVFDTGNRYGENDNAQQIIIPYLQRLGVKRLQSLIISHPDADHIGGLDTLVQHYSMNEFLISGKANIKSKSGREINQIQCRQGMVWQESGVVFRILAPLEGESNLKKKLSLNNRSCVLLIESEMGSVLLPGDIERETEHELVEKWGDQMSVDVLVLAHHGSNTSTSPVFFQTVRPSIAIASSAYLSRHGHPHAKVISRVKKNGTKLFNTATSGSVKVSVLKTGLKTIEYRAIWQRFWYATN